MILWYIAGNSINIFSLVFFEKKFALTLDFMVHISNFVMFSLWVNYLIVRLKIIKYGHVLSISCYSDVIFAIKIAICLINNIHPSCLSATLMIESLMINQSTKWYLFKATTSAVVSCFFYS